VVYPLPRVQLTQFAVSGEFLPNLGRICPEIPPDS
jgi:hypothetical protein